MKYFQLLISTVVLPSGKCWIARLDSDFANGVWLGDCRPVQCVESGITAKYPEGHFMFLDYLPCSMPIVSMQLRTILERFAPESTQYIPVTFTSDGRSDSVEGYYAANLLTSVDCIDRTRTAVADDRWERMPSGNFPIRGGIAIDHRLVGDYLLFRIDGYAGHVVVRQDLKEAIERQGITGCRFIEMPTSDGDSNATLLVN